MQERSTFRRDANSNPYLQFQSQLEEFLLAHRTNADESTRDELTKLFMAGYARIKDQNEMDTAWHNFLALIEQMEQHRLINEWPQLRRECLFAAKASLGPTWPWW